jgi:hypothetical protein
MWSLKQFLNFDFMKDEVENVCSSSIDPNICIVVISTNLIFLRNECFKMYEASNVQQSHVKGLTWNGASIAIATLDFVVILNMLDYISKTRTYIMVGQILAIWYMQVKVFQKQQESQSQKSIF